MRVLAALCVFAAACSGFGQEPVRVAPVTAASSAGGSSASSGSAAEPTPPVPPEPPPRHPVFQLADNRLLAHVQRGGALRLVAGSAGFAKYLVLGAAGDGWALGKEREGVRVAIAEREAELVVPLTEEQAAAATEIAIRLHTRRGKAVTVRLNGARGGAVAKLGDDWQVARVAVPAGALRAGENRVKLKFEGSDVAVEWIELAAAAAEQGATPAFAAPATLVLPRDAGLAYYVHVPAGARLDAAVSGEGCSVAVRARAADGAAVEGTLLGTGAHVDLAPVDGRVARLELTGKGCDAAGLEGAALTLPGRAPELPPRGKPPRFIVLWVMDTLRADRVRPFNPSARAEVPTWDDLAQHGAVFVNAYSQGNESQAAHASIWTSTYPIRHGVSQGERHHRARFTREQPLLGRAMEAHGMYVLGVTANGYVTSGTGYAQGFDIYANLMRDGTGSRTGGRVPSEWIWERAVKHLSGRATDPWFTFLGTIDTHKPWVAYEPWISRYDPEPYRGPYSKQARAGQLGMIHKIRGCIDVPKKRDFDRIMAIYDSDVSYQDDWVGKVRAQLEAWGIADETMIILTADHGEELWEHGKCGHGYSLRDMLLHVPLLVYYPPLIPPARVTDGAETMDILPTILDALGQPIPDDLQGDSLIPLAHGVGAGYPRAMYSTNQTRGVAMRVDRWKLRVSKQGKKILLTDVVADPAEFQELEANDRPLEYRFVADPMAIFLAHEPEWSKRRWGVASNMKAQAASDLGE